METSPPVVFSLSLLVLAIYTCYRLLNPILTPFLLGVCVSVGIHRAAQHLSSNKIFSNSSNNTFSSVAVSLFVLCTEFIFGSWMTSLLEESQPAIQANAVESESGEAKAPEAKAVEKKNKKTKGPIAFWTLQNAIRLSLVSSVFDPASRTLVHKILVNHL